MQIKEISQHSIFYILEKGISNDCIIYLGLAHDKYHLDFILWEDKFIYNMITFKEEHCEHYYRNTNNLEDEQKIHKHSHKTHVFNSVEGCRKFLKNYYLANKLLR